MVTSLAIVFNPFDIQIYMLETVHFNIQGGGSYENITSKFCFQCWYRHRQTIVLDKHKKSSGS